MSKDPTVMCTKARILAMLVTVAEFSAMFEKRKVQLLRENVIYHMIYVIDPDTGS